MNRRIKILLWSCILVPELCVALESVAQTPGGYDTSFHHTGQLTMDFAADISVSTGCARQTDGKIIVAGTSGSRIAVCRYLPGGTLDAAYGGGGVVLADSMSTGTTLPLPVPFALDVNNRVVVAGPTGISRLDMNGNPDPTFGLNGRITSPFGYYYSNPVIALIVQPDGKIITAGNNFANINDYQLILFRFKPNGQRDSTFGQAGQLIVHNGLTDVEVNTLGLQADGKILCGGTHSNSWMMLRRLSPSGNTDSTFGINGTVIASPAMGSTSEGVQSLVVQPDGKIIAGGKITNNGGYRYLTALRFMPNGVPDSSFGQASAAFVGPFPFCSINTLALHPSGKILFSGFEANSQGLGRYITGRLNSNGIADSTFATIGYREDSFTAVVPGTSFTASGLCLWSDGTIITTVQGGDIYSGKRFQVASLDSTGAYAAGFGTNGKVATVLGTSTDDVVKDVLPQSDGKLVLAGIFGRYQGFMRLFANGTPDASFGSYGNAIVGIDTRFTPANGDLIHGCRSAGGVLYALNTSGGVRAYLPGGAADMTFGTTGYADCMVPQPQRMLLQPDGKLLFLGNTGSFHDTIVISRLNPNGSPDITFNGTGYRKLGHTSDEDALGLALQTDGKIVVGGGSYIFGNYQVLLARINANGSSDLSFGNAGFVDNAPQLPAFAFRYLTALAQQSTGKIVATGINGDSLFVARYTTTGQQDSTFGINGLLKTRIRNHTSTYTPAGQPYNEGLLIQPDDKIVISTNAVQQNTLTMFGTLRLQADGAPDLAFGINGYNYTTFGSSNSVASAIALQQDGRLVCGGWSSQSFNKDCALIRLYSGLAPIPSQVVSPMLRPIIDARFSPNPLTQYGVLNYTISEACQVDVFVTDAYGQRITTLSGQKLLQPGSYQLPVYFSESQPAGLYFVHVHTPSAFRVLKVIKQ